jgi:hypothetical protein
LSLVMSSSKLLTTEMELCPVTTEVLSNFKVKVKVKVTLRLTVDQSVSQSVCLDAEPLLVIMTRCLLLFDDYCCGFVGRPL